MRRVLITGKNGNISRAIFDCLKNKHEIVSEQLSLRGENWKNFELSNFDTIVHVAGIVPKEGVNSEDFYEINYRLTEDFAEKAKNAGVQHFIYISSMAVYGVEPQISIKKGTVKQDTPCNPTSDYGKSKLFAEQSLHRLEDTSFNVTIIRVPSIYGRGKTEYLDQYKHLAKKFSKIPKVFTKNYKSMICIENLCELIYLAIKNRKFGIICPDDGEISAFEICKTIMPQKKASRFLGVILWLFKHSGRIKDYYGTVCYSKDITNVFNGEYRVLKYNDAIKKSYEE